MSNDEFITDAPQEQQHPVSLQNLEKEQLIDIILNQNDEIEALSAPPKIKGENFVEISIPGMGNFKCNSPDSNNAALLTNIEAFIYNLKLKQNPALPNPRSNEMV